MKKIPYLLLKLTVLVSGCGYLYNPQQRNSEVTTSPTPKPLTASISPSPAVQSSPTSRPTSTPKPSPTYTPHAVSSSTPTGEPSPALQQPTTLPDGTLLLVFGKLDIIGSAKFLDQTSVALSLLQDKSPDAYEKIQTYVGLIEQGEHSGMWAFENPPRYEVGQRTADSSTTWYASTIAHDATHSELYHRYLEQNGVPVPEDAWAGVEAEKFCIAYQLITLKEIGGTAGEIDYLASQSGTHCDVDDDGDCDWDDYDNRDW